MCKGRYFPSLLELRRTAETTLDAFAMGLEPWRHHGTRPEAYVHGNSTRSVDDLNMVLGAGDVSKSQARRLCAEIGARVNAFLSRLPA